jgi:hypothetical protein
LVILGPPRFGRPPFFPPDFNPPSGDYTRNDGEEEEMETNEEQKPTQSAPPPLRLASRPQPFDVYMCDKEFWPNSSNDEAFSKASFEYFQVFA